MSMHSCAFFVNKEDVPGTFWIERSHILGFRIMSTPDLASMPSRAWSCSTLQQGVAKCAEMAGVALQPNDMADALKARGYHVILVELFKVDWYKYISLSCRKEINNCCTPRPPKKDLCILGRVKLKCIHIYEKCINIYFLNKYKCIYVQIEHQLPSSSPYHSWFPLFFAFRRLRKSSMSWRPRKLLSMLVMDRPLALCALNHILKLLYIYLFIYIYFKHTHINI